MEIYTKAKFRQPNEIGRFTANKINKGQMPILHVEYLQNETN